MLAGGRLNTMSNFEDGALSQSDAARTPQDVSWFHCFDLLTVLRCPDSEEGQMRSRYVNWLADLPRPPPALPSSTSGGRRRDR
jgi:hypothetical protein